MDAKTFQAQLAAWLHDIVLVTDEGEGVFVISTPLLDVLGEPIDVRMKQRGAGYVLDDYGRIAHMLFARGHSARNSQAVQLLQRVADAHHVEVNGNEGVIAHDIPADALPRRLIAFARFVSALDLVLSAAFPPGTVKPPRSMGPRVAGDIARVLRAKKKLGFVERRVTIEGRHMAWGIDFAYRPAPALGGYERIAIVGIDLAGAEPLAKVEHVLTLANDVLRAQPGYAVRVAYDTHGVNGFVTKAANMVKDHPGVRGDVHLERLPAGEEHRENALDVQNYKAYDMRDDVDKKRFYAAIDHDLPDLVGAP